MTGRQNHICIRGLWETSFYITGQLTRQINVPLATSLPLRDFSPATLSITPRLDATLRGLWTTGRTRQFLVWRELTLFLVFGLEFEVISSKTLGKCDGSDIPMTWWAIRRWCHYTMFWMRPIPWLDLTTALSCSLCSCFYFSYVFKICRNHLMKWIYFSSYFNVGDWNCLL